MFFSLWLILRGSVQIVAREIGRRHPPFSLPPPPSSEQSRFSMLWTCSSPDLMQTSQAYTMKMVPSGRVVA